MAEPVAVLGDLLDVVGEVGGLGLDGGALAGGYGGLAGGYLDIGKDGVAVLGVWRGVRYGSLRRIGRVGLVLDRGLWKPVQGSRAVRGAAPGSRPGLACRLVVGPGTADWSCNIRSSNKRRRTRAACRVLSYYHKRASWG